MRTIRLAIMATLLVALAQLPGSSQAPAKRGAREALQPFNELIGTWRGTGTPSGTREEQQKGFWVETIATEWQFKGKDAWIKFAMQKGKHFESGELRYLPDQDEFQLVLKTTDKKSLTFTGKLKEKVLTMERKDESGEGQRLVLTMLHPERFLYHYEVRPANKTLFARKYQVGATREGVAFAKGDGKPECIVSGGLGTIAVTFQGQTYYVCCSGCQEEFNASPAKYVQEYKARQAKKK